MRELGFYAKYLQRYYELFGENNIHIAIHEEFFKNLQQETAMVYKFLGVDETFSPDTLNIRINQRKAVRSHSFVSAIYTIKRLMNTGLMSPVKRLLTHTDHADRLMRWLRKINLKDGDLPQLSDSSRKELFSSYTQDIKELEKLIGRDLSLWKR